MDFGRLERLFWSAGRVVLRGPPNRDRIASLLGLEPDLAAARALAADRERTIAELADCRPADSAPGSLAGYVGEAALRFFQTLKWVERSLRDLNRARPRVLEIGSNPYFFSLLMADRFPHLEHLGVNYFGAETPAMESQKIIDQHGKPGESRFFHADIERHDLEPAGEFDLALFCEVLEHLPFDPAWAFYNVARRLRPGGQLILSTPNPARMENLVKMIEERATFSDPISGHGIHGRHNREYSAWELRDLAEGAGLRVIETGTIEVSPDLYSPQAERRGYGAYHLLRAARDGEVKLYRPAWLYRGFAAEVLANPRPIHR
jgi:SAM-dependent methyltransferase